MQTLPIVLAAVAVWLNGFVPASPAVPDPAAALPARTASTMSTTSTTVADTPVENGSIAFVRDRDIWVTENGRTVPLTTDHHNLWPRWSPTGNAVAYVHRGEIWITWSDLPPDLGIAVTRGASVHGPPAWSPDGGWIAYWDADRFDGGLYVIRAGPELFAAGRRLAAAADGRAHRPARLSRPAPRLLHRLAAAPARSHARAGFSRLAENTGIAWSPDGKWMAFVGGECLAIYDDCLSVLELSTNREYVVSAWGGGGSEFSGYSTMPAWTRDSARLLWTSQHDTPDGRVTRTQIWSADPYGRDVRQLGRDGDSVGVPSPANDGTLLVTTARKGRAWVTRVDPDGAHTRLFPGYQQDWQVIHAKDAR